MAKRTLLDLTQSILAAIDTDSVNSIYDTVESEQVALIIKNAFYAMIDNRNWPHLHKLVSLTPSGDEALPTHVTVPDNVKELLSLNYNKARLNDTRKMYTPVRYICPDDFLRITNGRSTLDPNVDLIVDPTGVELTIYNNASPSYFTSFNDSTLVFDSYDSDVDDTIQKSKIQARAVVSPDWEMEDDFIPDLPSEAFSALLAEAKSTANYQLRQMQDPKAEQEAQRQQSWLSRKAWRVAGGVKYPNFGRKGKGNGCYKDPTFRS